jgi:hypothetical protein
MKGLRATYRLQWHGYLRSLNMLLNEQHRMSRDGRKRMHFSRLQTEKKGEPGHAVIGGKRQTNQLEQHRDQARPRQPIQIQLRFLQGVRALRPGVPVRRDHDGTGGNLIASTPPPL